MAYLPFSVFSFQLPESSFSQDSLLPPIPAPQWDGLPWPPSISFFKELAFLFKILFLFKTPPLETLCHQSSLYGDRFS